VNRPGRPPQRATGPVLLTVRIPADIKNYLVDSAEMLDMSITEYLIALIRRDEGTHAP